MKTVRNDNWKPAEEATGEVREPVESHVSGTGEALQQARNALRYDEFIWRVQREAGLSTLDAAALAVRATLTTFAERLRAEADESVEELIAALSCQMPERLAQPLAGATGQAHLSTGKDVPAADGALGASSTAEFSMTEFCRRVGRRSGVGLAEAERHARAVAITLDAVVSGLEVDRVRSRLPDEYEFLFV